MSAHGTHPNIEQEGLADGCERCTKISLDPFAGLDEPNLLLLTQRTKAWMRDEQFPRSDTENAAMRLMEQTLVRANALKRIGTLA